MLERQVCVMSILFHLNNPITTIYKLCFNDKVVGLRKILPLEDKTFYYYDLKVLR